MSVRKTDTKKALAVLAELRRLYPDPHHYLKFASPFQLLVATILSAQCTDERVNEVTAGLFKKYRGPADFAGEAVEALEQAVRPTGFYRNKAKAIKGASAAISTIGCRSSASICRRSASGAKTCRSWRRISSRRSVARTAPRSRRSRVRR